MKHLGSAALWLLAEAGIRVTLHPAVEEEGWGWWLEGPHLQCDWQGPYETTWEAAQAALDWLLQRAATGVRCEQLHSDVDPDALKPWRRAFEEPDEPE